MSKKLDNLIKGWSINKLLILGILFIEVPEILDFQYRIIIVYENLIILIEKSLKEGNLWLHLKEEGNQKGYIVVFLIVWFFLAKAWGYLKPTQASNNKKSRSNKKLSRYIYCIIFSSKSIISSFLFLQNYI